MIVITLTSCPPALRGDLTSWLMEIDTGVFVGHVNARVRDELWKRVKAHAKNGRATMVFSTNKEQRMDFRVHNASWEPIDFDGLKLMLRPSLSRASSGNHSSALAPGFSQASQMHIAKQMAKRKRSLPNVPSRYALIDVETTGLNLQKDNIIEVAALQINQSEVIGSYQALIRQDQPLPDIIVALTGISDSLLSQQGIQLKEAMSSLISFVGDLPVVSHNVSFDYNFLRAACARCGLPLFSNPCTDTLSLSKRLVKDVHNYKLTTLANYFQISIETSHRSTSDCLTTKSLYEKLIEIMETTQ